MREKKRIVQITNPRNDATTVDYCYCGDDDVYAADVDVADDGDVDLSPLVVVSTDYARLTVCTKRSSFYDIFGLSEIETFNKIPAI